MNLYLKKYTAWILTSLVSLSLLVSGLLNLPLHNVSAAVLTVPSIFSNNAVLQRNMPVPIFGTAAPGATVTVNFQGQNVSTTAVAGTGKWQVNLASMSASTSPSNLVITSGSESLTLTGVQVGEVWDCSGQSNMVKELSAVYEGPAAAADAPNHNIRLFMEASGGTPTGVTWTVADATTAGAFSAVCYFFGYKLSDAAAGQPADWLNPSGDRWHDHPDLDALQRFLRRPIRYAGETDPALCHSRRQLVSR